MSRKSTIKIGTIIIGNDNKDLQNRISELESERDILIEQLKSKDDLIKNLDKKLKSNEPGK